LQPEQERWEKPVQEWVKENAESILSRFGIE
jgi:hypothetical protein